MEEISGQETEKSELISQEINKVSWLTRTLNQTLGRGGERVCVVCVCVCSAGNTESEAGRAFNRTFSMKSSALQLLHPNKLLPFQSQT